MPTALLCTDEFGPLARAESEVLGMAGLPLVAVPHPLAGNEIELVTAKAAGVSEEVRAVLTGTVDELESKYASRFNTLTERRLDGGAVCVDEVCAIDPALGGQ